MKLYLMEGQVILKVIATIFIIIFWNMLDNDYQEFPGRMKPYDWLITGRSCGPSEHLSRGRCGDERD